MKIIFRILLWCVFSVLILFSGLWGWFQWVYLPGPGRQAVSQKLETALGRPVEIRELTLGLTGNLSLKGIRLLDTEGGNALVDAEELVLHVKLPDLITRRQITLSAIQVRQLAMHGHAEGVSKDFTVEGTVRIPLDAERRWDVGGLMLIKAGRISGIPRIGEITDLKGTLFFDEKRLVVQAQVGGIPYTITGSILPAEMPIIQIQVLSEMALLDTEVIVEPNRIEIRRLDGYYQNISFKASGEVPSIKKPSLELVGGFDLNLEDFEELFPKKEALKRVGLEGPVHWTGSLSISGSGLQATGKLRGPEVKIHRFQLDRTYVLTHFDNGRLIVEKLGARFHGGMLQAVGEVDFTGPHPLYHGRINVYRAKLDRLLPEKTVSAKRISGRVGAEMYFNGQANDLGTLRGKGRLLLSEGQIWEIPLLAGIGNLLKIPGLNNIPIQGGQGNFAIENRRYWTDGLILNSPRYELVLSGSLGFDETLDMLVKTHLARNPEKRTPGLSILSGTLLEYSDIEIGGTLKKPKYKVKLLQPGRLLLDTLQKNILKPFLE